MKYFFKQLFLLVFFLGFCASLVPSTTHSSSTNTFKPSIIINGGSRSTTSRRVDLAINGPRLVENMRIANTRDALKTARWEVFRERWDNWYLTEGNGSKTVFVQFQERDGTLSGVYSDSISYTADDDVYVEINDGNQYTDNRRVTVSIGTPSDARRMRVSVDPDISSVTWGGVSKSRSVTLDDRPGVHYVYVQFQTTSGGLSNIYQDSIEFVPKVQNVYKVSINKDAKSTATNKVGLGLTYSSNLKLMRVSNSEDFSNEEFVSVAPYMPWTISGGAGQKTVYVEFADYNDKRFIAKDTIVYEPVNPTVSSPLGSSGGNPTTISSRYPVGTVVAAGRTQRLLYVGEGGRFYVIPDRTVFFSWFSDLRYLRRAPELEVGGEQIVGELCLRAGTYLLQFSGERTIYAIEPSCFLRALRSETELFVLYGESWRERLLVLPQTKAALYRGREYFGLTQGDPSDDLDGDGLTALFESRLGTRDNHLDSDGDLVSDYEEVMYWQTDPTDTDTDNDGVSDGEEIMAARAPNGSGSIDVWPKNSYKIPAGSAFRPPRGRIYVATPDGRYAALGSKNTDKLFRSNQFQDRFILNLPFRLDSSIRSFTPKEREPILSIPQKVDSSGKLINL